MTKNDVNQYILDKKIPLSFIWKDNKRYWLDCYVEKYSTSTDYKWPTSYKFPNWDYNDNYYDQIVFQRYTDILFYSKNKPMKKIITDFLFWFELNKHKCKSIRYYQQ